jgi:superfamily I DNA/RNA helicase
VGDALEEAFYASGIPYQRIRRSNPRQEAEELDPRAEAVTLMTIHASKGLEFPVVFVAGCEADIIPYLSSGEATPEAYNTDEERRLLYVAMTRARGHLFLTRSMARTLHGRLLKGLPSPYLDCLDRSVCEFIDPMEGRRSAPPKRPKQGELFG